MSNTDKLHYKTCREYARLTQEQAIVLLGISEIATLSKYENGHMPVNQALVANMVKVYRVPSLAWWHLRYANPDLAQYLPEVKAPVTDGDMMLQMEFADDDITAIREAIKKILKDGIVTLDEAESLKINSRLLKDTASKLISSATYLEEREML